MCPHDNTGQDAGRSHACMQPTTQRGPRARAVLAVAGHSALTILRRSHIRRPQRHHAAVPLPRRSCLGLRRWRRAGVLAAPPLRTAAPSASRMIRCARLTPDHPIGRCRRSQRARHAAMLPLSGFRYQRLSIVGSGVWRRPCGEERVARVPGCPYYPCEAPVPAGAGSPYQCPRCRQTVHLRRYQGLLWPLTEAQLAAWDGQPSGVAARPRRPGAAPRRFRRVGRGATSPACPAAHDRRR